MIDAAIVGLGRWGKTLVEAVQGKSDKIRFTRAVSRNPSQHREFLEKHHLLAGSSLAEALADKSIKAVALATPHTQHVDEVITAAGAGKAVFCEKPLALTKEGTARAISDFELLAADDPVAAWRGRMLDAFGGYARKSPAYGG